MRKFFGSLGRPFIWFYYHRNPFIILSLFFLLSTSLMNTCLIEQKMEYISQRLKNTQKPKIREVVKEITKEVIIPQECNCQKTVKGSVIRRSEGKPIREEKPSLQEKLDKLMSKWEEEDKAEK